MSTEPANRAPPATARDPRGPVLGRRLALTGARVVVPKDARGVTLRVTLRVAPRAAPRVALAIALVAALPAPAAEAVATGAGAMREAGHIALAGQRISAVAIRPDGRQVAAVTEAQGGTLVLVDLQPAPVLRKAARLATTNDVGLRFSPDGRWVTLNGIDTRQYDVLALVDADTGAVATKVPVDGRRPPALAFSPDGRWLAVHTRARTLTVLDLHAPQRLGILGRLLAWLRSAPTVAAQVHPLALDGVTALSFSPRGDRLRVHAAGQVLELSAPEFRPDRGRALPVLHPGAWVTVCGDGTVAEFLGSERPVLFRYGPRFLARPDVDPGPLGASATALPFAARTIGLLTLRGRLLTAWCDEARGRLYALTDTELVAWDAGPGQESLQRIAYPPWAGRAGARTPVPPRSDWHAARNRASEIVVLSLATGGEVGWIAGDAASGGGEQATAQIPFAADGDAGLLVTGSAAGMLRLWRAAGAAR